MSGPTLFAVTGAECVVTVADRAVAFAEPVLAPAGARVLVGRATRGVRSYVAVAGGVAVDAGAGFAVDGHPRARRTGRAPGG